MSQALYRKWRPQTWDEVVGQDHIVQTLRNSIKSEREAHAYLFAGPRGTGKTTTARLLAKAVNCLEETLSDRPCNRCSHCQAVNEARFLDLIEIDAASNTSVEDVRNLRDRINFSPNEGRYKVYIIDEVHMLSTAAFNALLKTLEEPPGHAIFILATTEVHKIPATVLSRCQRHEFRRLPVNTIVNYLQPLIEEEQLTVEPQALELIARQATGSLRDAISLVDQLASTGEAVTVEIAREVLGTAAGEAVRGVIQAIVDRKFDEGLSLINAALDGGADPRQFARQVVAYLRGLLLIHMGNAALVDAADETHSEMARQAEHFPLSALLASIRSFSQAATQRSTGWQPALPLEVAFVEAAGFQLTDHAPAQGTSPRRKPEPVRSNPPAQTKKKSDEVADMPKKTGPMPTRADKLSFQTVLDSWRDVLAAARRHDPRTQALLNSCRPLGIEAGTLVIGFSSDLLREKMEKGHNLSMVTEAFQEILGHPLGVRCVLTDRWQNEGITDESPPPVEDGGMVSTALRDLGAQVVDFENLPPDGGS
jgi:DNA polymerase-3 subunit gamma/tau